MNNIEITVLLPIYNGEKYIRKAIDSILCQTFRNFEFLIINDYSTDQSEAIIKTYNDPRIKFISNKSNLGLIETLNIGLKLAQGEYIARMDQDDISFSYRLEKQIAYLDNHPEIGVCGAGFRIIDNDDKFITETRFTNLSSLLSWQLHFFCPIAHPTVMMRKSLIKKIGGYNKNALYCEDYDLWTRLNPITHITNINEVLLSLRKHNDNMSRRHFVEQINNSINICSSLISKTLNEEISSDLIRQIYLNEISDINSAIKINDLIRRLYESFINANNFTKLENKLISHDYAHRLLSLNGRFWYDIRVWKIFIKTLTLDPWIIFKGFKYLILNLVKNRS